MEHITKQGDKKQKYNVDVNGICVTDTGDIYVTDNKKKRRCPSVSVRIRLYISQYTPT
jgi:hypothetical protein